MSKRGQLLIGTIVALAALALLAPAPSSAAGMAMLRIVHASPDAPAIQVYVDGQPTLTAPQFAEATAYITVPAGRHQISVFAAGAGRGGKAFIDTAADLQDGRAYTIVAADRLANIEPVLLTDEVAQYSVEQAHVRLVHASPDAPPVADIALSGGGPVVFRDVPFKGATAYAAIPPGDYRFDLRPAGTTQGLATTNALTVAAGRSYTVFAMGELGSNSFRVIAVPDNARTGGVSGAPSTGGGAAGAPSNGPATVALIAGFCGLLVMIRTRRHAR